MRIAYKLFGIIALLCVVVSYSCKKTEMLETDNTNNSNDYNPKDTTTVPIIVYDSIRAGIYDTSFIYHEFQNPIILNLVWESSMLVGNANASVPIQLYGDSITIQFRLKIINDDSAFIISQMDTFIISALNVSIPDSFSVYGIRRTYYVGLGSYTDFNFVRALQKHDWISTRLLWMSNYCNNLNRWESLWEMPTNTGTVAGYMGGPWFGVGIAYIGIRYKKHLGWMKIDNSNKYAPKIISYAIKK